MGAQGNVKAGPSRLRNTACVVRTALAVTLDHGSPGARCPHTQELDVPGPCEGGDAPFDKGRGARHRSPCCSRSARSMAGAQGAGEGADEQGGTGTAVGRGRTGAQVSDPRLSALTAPLPAPQMCTSRARTGPGASFILYPCAQRTAGKPDGQQRSEPHAQRHGL